MLHIKIAMEEMSKHTLTKETKSLVTPQLKLRTSGF